MIRKALVALARIAAVSTLLFVGWGPTELSSFFANSTRALLCLALLARQVGESFSLEMECFEIRRPPLEHQDWTPVWSGLLTASLCCVLPFMDRHAILTFATGDRWRYLGLTAFLIGAAVQLTAQRTLGRQYSTYIILQKDHQLIKTGIYRLIRHPIYLGLIFSILGVALVFRSLLAAPLAMILTVFVAWRIQQEEKLLSGKFGIEYDTYTHSTRRMLPYFY